MRFALGVLFALLLGAPAFARCGDAATGPAKAAIDRIAWTLDAAEIYEICAFYGDYTGDRRNEALAFIYFHERDGGNATSLHIHKFRLSNGAFQSDGAVDGVFGDTPRNVRFSRNLIRVVTTTLGPNDARCCPSEATEWKIEIR